MSPLLASLALLSLYWQPLAGVSWKMETQNLASYISREQQSKVGASIRTQSGGAEVTLERRLALFNLMPNTMILKGLQEAGAQKKVEFMVPSLVNGFFCELDDPSLTDKLMKLKAAGQTPAQFNRAMSLGMKQNFNIDCAEHPPTDDFQDISASVLQKLHACFCVDKRGAVCITSVGKFAIEAESKKQGITVKVNPCLNETVPVLLKTGSGALGAAWKNLEKFGPITIKNVLSGNVEAFATADKADILCDAINPDVENAVKAVYASDGLYWFTESLFFAMLMDPSEKTVEITLAQYCSLDAVQADAYGRCFCTATQEGQGTGFTFCIYKVIAEYFVSEGHLTCDKTDKTKQIFVAERKPRSIPQLVTHKANGTAIPENTTTGPANVTAGPANVTSGPANSTVAPASIEAATGSAATSSLTAASLAAAALLLLRE